MVELERRVFLGAAATVLGGTATTGDVLSQSETDDAGRDGPWPQFQVGPANAGFAGTQGPRANLGKKWQYDGVGHWGVRSGPALVDGTLYFASLEDDIAEEGYVHAVDAAGGSRNWRSETGMRHEATPAVASGRVFVGDGELLALDASDGSEQWRADREAFGSPTVADGTVYASTSDEGTAVAAFDAADGSVEWTFDPATEDGDWRARTTPAVAGDALYVGVVDGTVRRGALYALAADTGERRWRAEVPALSEESGDRMAVFPPAAAGDAVYVSAGRDYRADLYALDAATGEERWSLADARRPTVAGDTVYAARDPASYQADDERVVALDASTGEERWTFTPDPDSGSVRITSELVVAGDALYFGTDDQGLYAIDAESGDLLDRVLYDRRGFVFAPPAVADGVAYVGTYGGDHENAVYAVVNDGPPPTPHVELAGPNDSPYCVDEPLEFHRQVALPDGVDPSDEDEYGWALDFDAADGSDPEFEPVDRGDGPAEHAYAEPGTYEAELTVRDPWDRTVAASTTVEVAECGRPTARIETDPPDAGSVALERETEVALDASVSKAEAGVESYEWDLGDDGDFETSGERVSYLIGEGCVEETLTVALRVTDTTGSTDTTSMRLSTERDGGK